MAWIESHQNLEEHPKILLLCQKTGWNLDEAIGKLHRLWWWALTYAEDGDLSKYDPSQFLVRLNGKLTPKELFEVLKETKFIEKSGLIHDWLDYAGRYLHSKYHSSNPKKWKEIRKKHKVYLKSTFRQPLGPNNLTVPNQPNQPNTIPQDIYSYYAKIIKAGAKEDAIRNITKLLKTVSKEDLMGRIDAYKQDILKKNTEDRYYIQANNFFGQRARYKDFDPIKPKPQPKPDPICPICKGKGRILEGSQKGATCLCVN